MDAPVARYAALLRGINLGPHKRVPMADLRELFQALGFGAVRTLLNSGNVTFSTPVTDPVVAAARIEGAVADKLELSVRCLVLTGERLSAVLDGNPLLASMTTGSQMMAHFLVEPPDPALVAANDPTDLAPDEVALGEGVIYQWCPNGLLAAPSVGAFVEQRLRVPVTTRNWNTVTKLAAALDQG